VTKDKVRSTEEALRLALEALEWQQEMLYTAMQYSAAKGMTFLGHPPNPNEAITAIKAALEAKDEPLQSVWNTLPSNKDVEDAMRMKRLQQLSTPPQRTWVGLTDGEISDCMEMSIQKTCRAIEAKLKEKNT
jgi:hypothetical protein